MTDRDHDLDWLMTNLTTRVEGASNAMVVTSDGLALATSAHLDATHADQLAAAASGLSSLTKGAARCFGAGNVNQIIVEMDGGYLFLTNVSDGSCLAVFATPTCDIGLIGYEMELLVAKVGAALTPGPRPPYEEVRSS